MRIRALVPVLLFGALNASPSQACTCVELNLSVRDQVVLEFGQASAVFEGKVESIETRFIQDALGSFDRRVVTLRVLRVYKGPKEKVMVVRTGTSDADCGFNFKRGGKYLVYAYQESSGQLATSICSRTRRLWRAGADGRYLNEIAREESQKEKARQR